MTAARFYRFSLLAPIVFPVAIFGIDAKSFLAIFLFISLGFGLAPYILFSVTMFYFIGKCGKRKLHKLLFLSPVWFSVLIVAFWELYYAVSRFNNPGIVEQWGSSFIFIPFALLVGYFYVAFVYLFYLLLEEFGHIRDTNID
ncbi:MAG: hypothetical protein OEZ68_17475 [Gammaproteobacteria bacterium]|nr:hypothetical protein [Gammaproteobacteria bacterium]MDH5802595.1 hypothetical protein [Gammaproteobacteria bacterium]